MENEPLFRVRPRLNPITFLMVLPLVLTACRPAAAPVPQAKPRAMERVTPARLNADEASGAGIPGKQYPVAEPIPGMPGIVRSPYTGKPVDLRGKKLRPVMADPTVMLAVRYFSLPAPESDPTPEPPPGN